MKPTWTVPQLVINAGDGSGTDPRYLAPGHNVGHMAIGDFNNDNRDDLAYRKNPLGDGDPSFVVQLSNP